MSKVEKIIGFDNKKYIRQQTKAILKRVEKFNNKLYLEFGGKLLFDYHAQRVLPGFDPNVKMRLLQKLKDKAEIILCIYAGDIERRKMRADFGITYDSDALKLIDHLNCWGLKLCAVVITRFEGQPAARIFKNKLERRKIKVYTHQFTKGYPADVDRIVSKEGYGQNPYIKTSSSLVVVVGPGPGSGKLATCLSQLYHEYKRGLKSGYAKFETFPIWNMPLKHPANIAYEAATADIKDYNMIDPFHLESYQKTAVNYNRDIEMFPVLQRIFKKITGEADIYQSPTDMGVNQVGFSVVDDQVVRMAASHEIIRRFFRYSCEYALGLVEKDTVERARLLMDELSIKVEQRKVVEAARQASLVAAKKDKVAVDYACAGAIELDDGKLITGKSSALMHASSSLILNAVKFLSGIPDKIHLLSPMTMESIKRLKASLSKEQVTSLDLEETLIALSISASTNPTAALALDNLKLLRNKEVHLTHIPSSGDEVGLRKLGVNLTSDPNFSSSSLFFE